MFSNIVSANSTSPDLRSLGPPDVVSRNVKSDSPQPRRSCSHPCSAAHAREIPGGGSERLARSRGRPGAREGETRQVAKARRGTGTGWASTAGDRRGAVSPCLASLACSPLATRRCWTPAVLAVSEYLLEPRLSRSFSLGREALTSAFHSEGTTGHVDHGLLQNTYSFILSPASSRDRSLFSFLQSFLSFCSSFFLHRDSSSNVGTRREMYTSRACDINVLACI